jgi:hypothetical protein
MIQWYHRGAPWSGYNDIRRQILQHGSIQPPDLVKDNYDNLHLSDPDKREGWMERQSLKRKAYYHSKRESVS